jgi:hypothetical protein
MQASGSNLTVNEVRKDAGGQPAGHWWWDTKSTNDGGVINDRVLREHVSKNHGRAREGRAAAIPPQP